MVSSTRSSSDLETNEKALAIALHTGSYKALRPFDRQTVVGWWRTGNAHTRTKDA